MMERLLSLCWAAPVAVGPLAGGSAAPPPPPQPSREEVLLTEIRDLLKERT